MRYAITIHLFRNLPLQFSNSLNCAILYVFDALGPTRRPVYFRMVQNTPWCFSPSLTDVWGPHVSFSFNLRSFFFLLPPTPGLVARPHRTPQVAARPPAQESFPATCCSWWRWRRRTGPRSARRWRGGRGHTAAAREPERPRPAGLAATAVQRPAPPSAHGRQGSRRRRRRSRGC